MIAAQISRVRFGLFVFLPAKFHWMQLKLLSI